MAVTAALVKELRERTGLGMMECKKALVETQGDIETAIDNLRKSGQAKAAKKAGRTAAEGIVGLATEQGVGVLLEVNSETDFVARNEEFVAFVDQINQTILDQQPADVDALVALPLVGGEKTVEQTRNALVQKIGENIQVRRFACARGDLVVGYVHSNQKVGAIVALNGGDESLGRDIAMHITATNPMVVNPSDVPESALAKEKEIFTAQAKESGKPDNIIEKMIAGRLKKFEAEVSLVEQPFVKDPDTKIGQLLKANSASVQAFFRYEVGEGIEKEEKDFAQEVMEQVRG